MVRPGDALLDIVPRNESLVVDARVGATDIDIVGIGQVADVRLTAFKQRVVPLLQGRVTYVAADISVDHPAVVDNYRAAQIIAARDARGEATTEDLRNAVVHYRVLFNELLEVKQG